MQFKDKRQGFIKYVIQSDFTISMNVHTFKESFREKLTFKIDLIYRLKISEKSVNF